MRPVRVIAWSCLAAAGFGCGAPRPSDSPIRIGYASGITTSSLWVADRAGYFEAQGVDIVWHRMDRPSTALPQLAADNFDVMSLHLTPALFALVDRGQRVRIVADRGHHPPTGCTPGAYVARRDLDPEHPSRRLRAGAAHTRWSEYLIDRLVASGRLGSAEVELVDLPSEAEVHALASGDIDLAIVTEPFLTRARETDTVRVWLPIGEVVPFAQHGVLVFGPRLLDRDRAMGERFLAAYLRAERELAAGKREETVQRLAEALDFEAELVRRMCWMPVRSDLAVNHANLADYQRWAHGKGLLDRIVSQDEYWDGAFAAAAVARLEGGG